MSNKIFSVWTAAIATLFLIQGCAFQVADKGESMPLRKAVVAIVDALDSGYRKAQESDVVHGLIPAEAEVTLVLSTIKTDNANIELVASPAQVSAITGFTGTWGTSLEQKNQNTLRIKFSNILLAGEKTIAATKSRQEIVDLFTILESAGIGILLNPQ